MKDDEEGEAGAQRVDPRVAARRHRRFCLVGAARVAEVGDRRLHFFGRHRHALRRSLVVSPGGEAKARRLAPMAQYRVDLFRILCIIE
jgi:hypothetical protein